MITIRKNILFVCTGNTCRSPFAEGMMRKLLQERYREKGKNIKVSSAGTYAFSGVDAPPDALEAGKKFGVDLSDHRSRSIHLTMMEASDVVFCMTAAHKAFLVAKFPWFEDKIFLLKKYAEGLSGDENGEQGGHFDIPDPIGQGASVYEDVFRQIKECEEKILNLWETDKAFQSKVSCTYRIAMASDHAGFRLKEDLLNYLRETGHRVQDFGVHDDTKSSDYPDFAKTAANAVVKGEADFAVLVCGSGVGMCITANKIKGIRAVLANDTITAGLSRAHNNCNVLCLGGRLTTPTVAKEIVETWLSVQFEGGRHEKRIAKIE